MPSAATNRDDSTVGSPAPAGPTVIAGADLLPPVQPTPLPTATVWSVLFLIYTGIAILLTGYRFLDDLSRNRSGTFGIRSLEEVTGVYTAFVLLPLVFRAADLYLFRPRRLNWVAIAFCHLAAGIAFSLAHTYLMAITRQILSPLLGLGRYDYGIMFYRYPMELSNDLVGFTSIVCLYYYFRKFRLAQAQQLAAAQLKTKLAEAQLENLRLQLQPHFLFNTLNTISSVMYEDIKAADLMLTQLSDLLRLTLRASRTHEIPLADELQITRLYLDLMQKRYEEKLRVNYSIDTALNDSLVPQLVLQPLLENSLRHGMKASGEAIDISIAAHRDNGSLILSISDTGVGLGASDPSAVLGRGVGLSNIRDRLAQLYGDAQNFSIANRPSGGAQVTLRLPYRTAQRSQFAADSSTWALLESASSAESQLAGGDSAPLPNASPLRPLSQDR
ncbi:MAG TPA: histidine kinase [Candidatus Sulfotelmatobacter sp.]|nr:histidine kinase [Candidatus Sulfotelmatobacter sp.]